MRIFVSKSAFTIPSAAPSDIQARLPSCPSTNRKRRPQAPVCAEQYTLRSRRGLPRRGDVFQSLRVPPTRPPASRAGQPEFDSLPPPFNDIHIVYHFTLLRKRACGTASVAI